MYLCSIYKSHHKACVRAAYLSDANGKIKVKFTLEQATKAQRGSRGVALPFL